MTTTTNSFMTSGSQQQIKREVKTITRTYENDKLVEEREETETEYEYVQSVPYTSPSYPQYPFITS